MGLAVSINTLGLFIISIIAGSLIQFFGYKKTLISGMTLLSLGCLGLSLSYNYYIFLFSYLIMGIGAFLAYINANSLISDFYPNRRGKTLLTLNIGWLIGVSTAPFLVSFILRIEYSWRILFLFIFLIQIIALLYISRLKFQINKYKNNIKLLFEINKNIFSDSNFIFICIIVFLNSAIMRTFSSWFTTYFLTINISIEVSSMFLALYSAFLILGMFVKKFLLKYFNEKQILLYNSIISLIFLLLSFITNIIFLKIIFILIFGINIIGFITISTSLAIETNPKYSTTVIGLIQGVNFLGIIIFQYIIGYLSEHFSKNSVFYIDLILLFVLCITTLFFNFYSKPTGIKNKQ